MDTEKHIISSEAEAFEFLSKLDGGSLDAKSIELEFIGWPIVEVKLIGKQFDASITTEVMKGFIDLEANLQRTYAKLAYNGNTHRLTKADRERLQLVVKVEKGSANNVINLQDAANQMINGAMKNMTPDQIFHTAIIAMVLYAGYASFKHYINKQVEKKEIEIKLAMSQEETKRVEIIQQIAQANPVVREIQVDAEEHHNTMLKSIASADRVEIAGIELSGNQLKDIVRKAREKSSETRIDELFKVDLFDATNLDKFRVHVRNDEKGLEFRATVSNKIATADQQLLLARIRERKPISLRINAKELRGEITSALIVGIGDLI